MTDSGNHSMTEAEVLEQVRLAAFRRARRQSPAVAAQADDIAMSVVEKFIVTSRQQTIENPVAWASATAFWMATDLAKRLRAQHDREESCDGASAQEPAALDPLTYPFRFVAAADALNFALSALSEREQRLVTLVAEGYSHAEVASIMGYSSARSVTTTLNRIRAKVERHVGTEEDRDILLAPVLSALRVDVITTEDLAFDADALSA